MTWQLYEGDCLDVMEMLPDHSVDMILCDLPYGTTACKWDTVIPFEPLWANYKRLIKDRGAIVLTAAQPFTSQLVMSNPDWFKYEWIWEKNRPSGFAQAKNKPLQAHETVLVFSDGVTVHASQSVRRMPYFPQDVVKLDKPVRYEKKSWSESSFAKRPSHRPYEQTETNYPRSVLKIPCAEQTLHPTQKPVELFEYLIKTYTNEGDTVLDNCAGSGTTGVAAERCGRKSIMIERDPGYCEIIRRRMFEAEVKGLLPEGGIT